jgi:palmitoyltransferase
MENLSRFAPVFVSILISILAYASQALFSSVEAYALEYHQSIIFNGLVACLWICYARACLTNPGSVPLGWKPAALESGNDGLDPDEESWRSRWCRKCEAPKPPRTHHCKTCKR